SIGAFTYNPRFPGQFYDVESNLHYNYFRDYDPRIGRYVQSDPIGLAGGVNSYSYVEASPTSTVDPDGLQPLTPMRPSPIIPGPAGQFPYIRPEWNYPTLPEKDVLVRICVQLRCPIEEAPLVCSPSNPSGDRIRWSSGPFFAGTTGLPLNCECAKFGWASRPNPFPVTLRSFGQNSAQKPFAVRKLLEAAR
ncbi:MAG: RHS repeat-associated core domain-containing protein, partial [Novosphingobium sp.]|nr:RHS repeat-associated core domain-containing protein [Novosphingobium sp.]